MKSDLQLTTHQPPIPNSSQASEWCYKRPLNQENDRPLIGLGMNFEGQMAEISAIIAELEQLKGITCIHKNKLSQQRTLIMSAEQLLWQK